MIQQCRPQIRTAPGHRITVVNRGRAPLILNNVGVYGLIPIAEAQRMLREERKRPRRLRGAIRRHEQRYLSRRNSNTVIVKPSDAYEVVVPSDVKSNQRRKLSGRYWWVFVESRSGRTWRLNGDAILRGERWLPAPRAIRDRLPDLIRLKLRRYKEIVRVEPRRRPPFALRHWRWWMMGKINRVVGSIRRRRSAG